MYLSPTRTAGNVKRRGTACGRDRLGCIAVFQTLLHFGASRGRREALLSGHGRVDQSDVVSTELKTWQGVQGT